MRVNSALGLVGVALNAFLPGEAFEIVMNLAGIGIAGTWAAILVTHLAFLRRVRAGLEQRPTYRMPGAPYTDYAALLFFGIVVLSSLTAPSGRWTLGSSRSWPSPWCSGGTQYAVGSVPISSTTSLTPSSSAGGGMAVHPPAALISAVVRHWHHPADAALASATASATARPSP